MRRRGRVGRTLALLAVAALGALVLLTSVAGRPVITYASSGSMEPTIGVFDAFLVAPWPASVEVGDIVVYRSLLHGGPAVHRIVGGGPSGWVTQGDANPTPDQDAGEPPVTPDRLLGKVVTRADGRPMIVPNVGIVAVEGAAEIVRLERAIGGPERLATVAFLALAAVFGAIGVLGGRPGPRRPLRPPTRRALRRLLPRGLLGRHVGVALALIVLATSAWSATHARGDVEISLVVVDDPRAADPHRAAAPGGVRERQIDVASLGAIPTVVILEPGSPRVQVSDEARALAPRSSARFAVHERAGDEVGLQRDIVHVWRYPAFLPRQAIEALHAVVPGGPYLAASGLLIAAGAAWFARLGVARLPVGRMLGMREDWL